MVATYYICLMDKIDIVNIEIKRIKPYAKNARLHSIAQVRELAQLIQEFGFNQPILLDRNNVVIAGHGRLEAAILLNMITIPCVIADKLSERQVMAFRLADNKVTSKSQWDFDLLGEELGRIAETGFDLIFTGFDEQEQMSLLEVDPEIMPDDDWSGETKTVTFDVKKGVSKKEKPKENIRVIVVCESEERQNLLMAFLDGNKFKTV